MNAEAKPLADVTRRAFEILARELGPADTARFLNQFTTGFGDYAVERERLFEGETLDQLVADIEAMEAEDAPAPDGS